MHQSGQRLDISSRLTQLRVFVASSINHLKKKKKCVSNMPTQPGPKCFLPPPALRASSGRPSCASPMVPAHRSSPCKPHRTGTLSLAAGARHSAGKRLPHFAGQFRPPPLIGNHCRSLRWFAVGKDAKDRMNKDEYLDIHEIGTSLSLAFTADDFQSSALEEWDADSKRNSDTNGFDTFAVRNHPPRRRAWSVLRASSAGPPRVAHAQISPPQPPTPRRPP